MDTLNNDARLAAIEKVLELLLEQMGRHAEIRLANGLLNEIAQHVQFEVEVACRAGVQAPPEVDRLHHFETALSRAIAKRR